jgi:hypothetical protein
LFWDAARHYISSKISERRAAQPSPDEVFFGTEGSERFFQLPNWINRWRTEERAKGKTTASSMRVLYAETKLMLSAYLQYSSAL